MANNHPFKRISTFGLSAAIWRNEDDGKVSYSVTFQRSWIDGQGKWANSLSFREADLPRLAFLTQQAATLLLELRATDTECPPPEMY